MQGKIHAFSLFDLFIGNKLLGSRSLITGTKARLAICIRMTHGERYCSLNEHMFFLFEFELQFVKALVLFEIWSRDPTPNFVTVQVEVFKSYKQGNHASNQHKTLPRTCLIQFLFFFFFFFFFFFCR